MPYAMCVVVGVYLAWGGGRHGTLGSPFLCPAAAAAPTISSCHPHSCTSHRSLLSSPSCLGMPSQGGGTGVGEQCGTSVEWRVERVGSKGGMASVANGKWARLAVCDSVALATTIVWLCCITGGWGCVRVHTPVGSVQRAPCVIHVGALHHLVAALTEAPEMCMLLVGAGWRWCWDCFIWHYY
jgi:hypothetical protein